MPKRNTKQLIADAAIDAYSKYGYKGTTCEDLATAVGIRPSALFKHYKNKRDIYDCAIQQLVENMTVAVQQGKSPEKHFQERPELLFMALHSAMAGNNELVMFRNLALEPMSAYGDIDELYSLAGRLVWESCKTTKL